MSQTIAGKGVNQKLKTWFWFILPKTHFTVFFTESLFTETPFDRTPFDRKAILPKKSYLTERNFYRKVVSPKNWKRIN
jgi:hypothetical protein